MQLIAILLITVSILALLSGISVLIGASKGSRAKAFMFFLATFGVFGWAVSMAFCLTMDESNVAGAKFAVYGIYLFTLIMDLFIVVYTSWKTKWGWLAITISSIGTIFMAIALLYNHQLLYSEINLSEAGNSITIVRGWYYLAYTALCGLEGLMVVIALVSKIKHTTNHSTKRGWTIFLVGLAIAWAVAGFFDLYLPLYRYDLIWLGPLAVSIDLITHYYGILRYRLLDMSSSWLRMLSHVIIMSLAAIIYLAVFFVVFISMFKVPSPSTSVIILNAIMIIVVLLLFPVLNEVSAYVRSLSSIKEIDIPYIVKKLSVISKEYINYRELAEFLADHMHFQYVGIYIDNKLYSSKAIKVTSTDIAKIGSIKPDGKDLWLPLDEGIKTELRSTGVEAIAILKDCRGETIGRIVFGRPLGNISFSNRNITDIETIMVLVATVISSEKNPTKS